MTKPTCEYCGTPRFLVTSCSIEGHPEIVICICARCDDVRRHGTDLAKAALLMQARERQIREANRETVKLLPGLTRNQRRRLLRDCEADVPELLEQFIQTAPLPFMDALRGGPPARRATPPKPPRTLLPPFSGPEDG